jgi:uncharacterized protein YdiU (UPF0061 family)
MQLTFLVSEVLKKFTALTVVLMAGKADAQASAETKTSFMTDISFKFDNRFCRELPDDPETENFLRRVEHACYSRVKPRQFASPKLLAYSPEVAADLDISEEQLSSELFTQVFSGNHLLKGMDPYAMCYGGHQFGNWAGQLGDGRAINLGEVVNSKGEYYALQLKGSGETPYSRSADGLAVLRSSLREFLCSEAMYHLGVPTTRALSLMTTGEQVVRDMLYDGNPQKEAGAVVCRVAPSFIRFGNFEIFAAQSDVKNLKALCDFTIKHHFPYILEAGSSEKERYLNWFREVCQLSAEMVVHWMRVGFVHGVMNTDNMSILGLTIDYGPYGWLEDYNPDWTPNTTDAQTSRYRFSHQPYIVQWNLFKLANTLMLLVDDAQAFENILNSYGDIYTLHWQKMMAGKLGLKTFDPRSDEKLINELEDLLVSVETDMTLFFRQLSSLEILENENQQDWIQHLSLSLYQSQQNNHSYEEKLLNWLFSYRARLLSDAQDEQERHKQMKTVNPKYVLRNYMAQLAIDDAEKGDNKLLKDFLNLLAKPYDEQADMEKWYAKRPEWARARVGCSMLSCSS